MRLKECILEKHKDTIIKYLSTKGFRDEWNEYCPQSRFYMKDLSNNKTIYIRKDLDKKYNQYIYEFEIWVRDNNKNIFDKELDNKHKMFRTNGQVDEIIKYVDILESEVQ